jgi:hypothetical protein
MSDFLKIDTATGVYLSEAPLPSLVFDLGGKAIL